MMRCGFLSDSSSGSFELFVSSLGSSEGGWGTGISLECRTGRIADLRSGYTIDFLPFLLRPVGKQNKIRLKMDDTIGCYHIRK